MRFHSFEANAKQLCDLLIRITFGNQLNHSTLTVSENRAWDRLTSEEGVEKGRRHSIGKVWFVSFKGLHGLDDVLVCIGLQEIAASTCFKNLFNQSFVLMHSKDENLGVFQMLANPPGNLDTVHDWQRVIDDGYIGLRLNGLADSLFPVGCLGHDFPIGMRFQDVPQT